MQPITATSPGTVSTSAAATPQPRLVHAAHEFEAQMMQELMEPMTRDTSLTGDDEDSDSDSGAGSGGALGEFASEALARAMSDQGGFGIANKIVGDLSHTGTHGVTIPVTGNLHLNTVMSESK
jgi:Rod binding domain-containing protein